MIAPGRRLVLLVASACIAGADGPRPAEVDARPHGGHPAPHAGLKITPRIAVSRVAGQVPFVVHVHAAETTAAGVANPYDELEYSWDFGDAEGSETIEHPVLGVAVDAEDAQRGPEAGYVYREPGTYRITLTARGKTPSGVAVAKVSRTVVASAWSGVTQHFDPDRGDDANPGTRERPRRSWSALESFLEGVKGSRRALLRRGTTLVATGQLKLEDCAGVRIEAYGEGAPPAIRADFRGADALLKFEIGHGYSVRDVVVSGIDLDAGARLPNGVFAHASENGNASRPYGVAEHIHFLDCGMEGGSDARVHLNTYTSGKNLGFWRCRFDGQDYPGQEILCSVADGFFVVGGSFEGGRGSMVLDHHIYPSVRRHALYRWVDFRESASKNFCINNNATMRKDGGSDHRYQLVDGCDVTGTQNGIDWSNTLNDPSDAGFRDVIVQGSAVHHAGRIGTQANGIYTTCVGRITVRDNVFHGNRSYDVVWSDPKTYPLVYRNAFSKDAAADGPALRVGIGADSGGEVVGNRFTSLIARGRTAGVVTARWSRLPGWTFAANRYDAPNLMQGGVSRPFYDPDSGSYRTLADWRSLGLDVDGSAGVPGPARGSRPASR